MIWHVLPWVLSFITLYSVYLAGNKNVWAWRLGLGNQVLWLALNIHLEVWGLLPLCFCMAIIYARNWLKWSKERK